MFLYTLQIMEKSGSFSGNDIYTSTESEKLLRLPMWYGIEEDMIDYVVSSIDSFN